MAEKLWSGRFADEMSQKTQEFTQSIEVDSKLIDYDIWGSQAHAIMLARQEIISEEDLRQILFWLNEARNSFQSGKLTLSSVHEDVHMNIELFLIEGAGIEFAGRLHSARSRNDQVLVDTKMFCRDQIISIELGLSKLCRIFLELADRHRESVMSGYTHTQHAQPISLGFWATAYVSMFLRDLKLLEFAYKNVNQNPLGACAMAGTSFPIDRSLTAKLLGFDGIHEHALDVVSSRDFIVQILSLLSQLSVNLSRLSEEIIYWSSYEFNILTLDDSYSSGSSIMPQKKNADIAELARGRTGRSIGALINLLTNLKGLPLGYNRDLQEDKPPLMDALSQMELAMELLAKILETATFNTDRMAQLADANFSTATELANYLVSSRNFPFRKSHAIVGRVVGELSRAGKTFSDWDRTEKILSSQGIEISIPQLQLILDPRLSLRRNQSVGGTSPKEVKRMSEKFSAELDGVSDSIRKRQLQIDTARQKTDQITGSILSGKLLKNAELP